MITVRCHLCIVAAAIALTASMLSTSAQTIRPLQIEHAVSARGFHVQGQTAVIAPDGELVAYTVCDPRRIIVKPGESDDRVATKNAAYRSLGCDVWVSPLKVGEDRNITLKAGNNWGPAWSPDGAAVAFYSDRSGAPRVWVWERGSGRSRMVADVTTRSRFGFELPIWTPDGKSLILKVLTDGPDEAIQPGIEGGSPTANSKNAVSGSTVVVFRSVPTSKDTFGNEEIIGDLTPPSDDLLADLAVIDVRDGQVRRIARNARTSTVRLSPDGRQLAILDNNRVRPNNGAYEYALVVVDVGSGHRRELVAGVRQHFSGAISWSPDSRWIAYASAGPIPPKSDGSITNRGGRGGDLYVVSPGGGSARRFTGAPEGIFSTAYLPPLWDNGGKHLYAIGAKKLWRADVVLGDATPIEVPGDFEVRRLLSTGDGRRIWTADGGSSAYVLTNSELTKRQGFYRVELATGRATRLVEGDKELDSPFSQPVVAANGQSVVYLSASAHESPDLWIAASDFAHTRRLTTINPELEAYTFGRSRLIDFRTHEGESLRATLLLPAGYEASKRYPLIVWVYAGSMGSRAPNKFGLVGFSAYNMHMLTTRGYAVMFPDVPVRPGSPMLDLMKAVMPALDRAVEMGIADADRLAVMGQSNGGYSTLSLLVQTNRFKAAVMNAGFGNLIALYGSMTDDGNGRWIPFLEQLGGAMGVPPWEAPLRYIQNSPVFYLDRVQTPLIIQAGTSDLGIVPHSDEVFVGLKRLNRDVTYLRYGGEGHTLASYGNLVDYWNRVIAFYNQRLGPTPSVPKAAKRR